MKSYYIAPLHGDGEDLPDPADWTPTTGPLRSSIKSVEQIYGIRVADTIGVDATGRPLYPWALVIVGAANHMPLRALPDVTQIPMLSLAHTWGSVASTVRAEVVNMLKRHGLPPLEILSTAPCSAVIEHIGKLQDPAFSVWSFDVPD